MHLTNVTNYEKKLKTKRAAQMAPEATLNERILSEQM